MRLEGDFLSQIIRLCEFFCERPVKCPFLNLVKDFYCINSVYIKK